MTTTLSPVPVFKGFDNNGQPLAFGKLFTYQGGTTTKLATYTDSTGITPNPNPVILNARGEAQIWVPPNVAYKYVLAPSTDTDPPTSPIWTVDQITNSQLITLYGGVDTGTSNAYVLTFPANFTSYTDEIIIYWIPSNTNSGASTINVNGLGIVNIVNPDGSTLSAGEITANVPSQILYKGGSFQLITPASNFTGFLTPSYTGFSIAPSNSVIYRRTGNVVVLSFTGTGTSNANSFQLTNLPAILTPKGPLLQGVPVIGLIDNGATLATFGVAQVSSTGVVNFYKDQSLTNTWTASGSKGFGASSTIVTYCI